MLLHVAEVAFVCELEEEKKKFLVSSTDAEVVAREGGAVIAVGGGGLGVADVADLAARDHGQQRLVDRLVVQQLTNHLQAGVLLRPVVLGGGRS
eukprot:COSAG04_NODE_2685_length_3740_cov_2.487229_6_plen_94_part_00